MGSSNFAIERRYFVSNKKIGKYMWVWKERSEIDTDEWNEYLEQSIHPFIEFSSWYLDICCQRWGAYFHLISKNRIPIPYTKKFILPRIITRPPFLQRLKIISINGFQELELASLLEQIKIRFPCGVLNWEYRVHNSSIRSNYILAKSTDGYNQSQNRNLTRSIKSNLTYLVSREPEELFEWLDNNNENYNYEQDFKNQLFKNLVIKTIEKDKSFILFAKTNSLEIQCAAIFTYYKSRYVFFLSFNSKSGKKNGSMVGLIHYVQNVLLEEGEIIDLEGSDIKGVANFYEGFGAINIPYYEIKWSNSILCRLRDYFKYLFH